MERPPPDSIRVISYNGYWDSIFAAEDPDNSDLREYDRAASFARMMRALQPDVLCLQEINYLRGTRKTGEFLATILGEDQPWQVVNVRDNVIATRFHLVEHGFELITGSFLPDLRQAAALIDLPNEAFGPQDLYMICAHFKAGGSMDDIQLRTRQGDAIAAHVGDAVTPGGEFDLPAGTPIVVLGDFNIYSTDPALHLRAMVHGDIYDEAFFGEDVPPDWDSTSFTDVLPSHNGLGDLFYTWRNDIASLVPGTLDRIFYSDSVLQVENSFILNTTLLSDSALAILGLERDDVILDPAAGFYDHLPLVVDFVILSK